MRLDPVHDHRPDRHTNQLRVLIVDGDPTAAAALGDVLNQHHDVIIGIAATTDDALAAVREGHPTVAIVDPHRLPAAEADILARLRLAAPHLPIILYTDLSPAARRTLDLAGVGRMVGRPDPHTLLTVIAETMVAAAGTPDAATLPSGS